MSENKKKIFSAYLKGTVMFAVTFIVWALFSILAQFANGDLKQLFSTWAIALSKPALYIGIAFYLWGIALSIKNRIFPSDDEIDQE